MSENQEQAAVEQEHQLCANGCGFFGSATTNYLCSKCYEKSNRAPQRNIEQKASPNGPNSSDSRHTVTDSSSTPTKVLPVESSMNTLSPLVNQSGTHKSQQTIFEDISYQGYDSACIVPSKRAAEPCNSEVLRPQLDSMCNIEVLESGTDTDYDASREDVTMKQRNIHRCSSCNRKVGLTGMECKCRLIFCSVHRYPEQHNCVYDFKSDERKNLERSAPGGGSFAKVDRL